MTAPTPFDPPESDQRWLDAARELAPGFAATAAELDDSGELPMENLTALHRAGVDLAVLPAEHGGAGLSHRAFGQVLDVLAQACPSTACIWLMHMGAAQGLVAMSSPESAGFYAGELAAGKRFANALSEPASGNLFLLPQQHATPVDGGFQLTGAKRFVSGCEIADHLLVNALVDGEPAFFGVQPDDTVRFVPIWDSMGLRATRSQLISFDGTVLRADRRCTGETSGAFLIPGGLAFLSLGVARAALGALIEHARSRTVPTTGQSIADMQWVRFGAADLAVRLDAATLLAQRSMWLADTGAGPAAFNSAVAAKLAANQVAKEIADLAVRVGGGSGYLRSSPIQRHFRDAQAGALMAYSVEVCLDVIGAQLLSPPPA